MIFFVTTLAASILVHSLKEKLRRNDKPLYSNPKTPRFIMIIGFIIFMTPIILINLYAINVYRV